MSFDVAKGEIVGLLGPNGAGKSTTVKILAGVLYPTSGDARILGLDPFKRRIDNARNIGVLFGQRSHLLWDLPPIDAFSLLRKVYGLSQAEYEARLRELSDLLGLDELMRQSVRTLSLGQRMRCELAAAFLHRPRVVYLDEPTIGLDIEGKHAIREFIRSISQEHHTAIILITHDLTDIQELCERVLVINEGALIYDGSLEHLMTRHASSRSIQAELADGSADAVHAKLAQRWPHAAIVVEGTRLRVSGIGASEDIVSAVRLIMDGAGLRSITVLDPPIEDVILSVYQHGVA